MKLSYYKGEKALDVLANMLEPATEILADSEISAILNKKEPIVKAIKVAIQKHKRAVIELLAAVNDTPVDEFEVSVFTLPKQLLELFNDPEISNLFSSQSQKKEDGSFGSAMANTKDTEN